MIYFLLEHDLLQYLMDCGLVMSEKMHTQRGFLEKLYLELQHMETVLEYPPSAGKLSLIPHILDTPLWTWQQ